MKKPYAIIIMDGYGISPETKGNAIALEGSPNVRRYAAEYPSSQLGASGMSVGLPDGQMGNSEVGHLNMGAGRIVYQELTKITKEIRDGEFFRNEALLAAMENAKKNGKKLHIWGLLSDGGVHSHNTHLYALLEMCKKEGLDRVYVHCFMDGRDVSPTSGAGFVRDLQDEMKKIGVGKVASVCGRYYAMDRDNRWERVVQAYEMLTLGNGIAAEDPAAAIEESYGKDVTDEFILPTNVVENGAPVALVEKGDSVIFFNFRPDRAREITRAFTEPDFSGFERKTGYLAPCYVCFTQYDETFPLPVAFKPETLTNILGDVLDQHGIKQFRTAETEKYAHVTFFFNGGVEEPNKLETRVLVASPKVATYDLQPEMSANEVCENVLKALDNPEYGFILVNFANPDMVGHTGVFNAAVKAIETVDKCVGKIADKAKQNGVTMLLTADHGNAECMEDPTTHKPFTAHTTNPVPFLVINDKDVKELKTTGALCDVAPTVLDILGIEKPAEMTGESLIIK